MLLSLVLYFYSLPVGVRCFEYNQIVPTINKNKCKLRRVEEVGDWTWLANNIEHPISTIDQTTNLYPLASDNYTGYVDESSLKRYNCFIICL